MLKPIKDCQEHIVCFMDAKTGLIESKYKRQTTIIKLAVGGELTIVRDRTETVIKRISIDAFEILSYPIAS
ncbi:hypothetical protein [Fusibacter tunisiensis]|uniref:Uncharacterized protein n=1 Tax=Fusibacter tunisiensis TaxID=1008308 RepID=A0ABS2MQ24_9FIRM|nr:hypothetical protein [Fusibacter tunisiensis]MBM7561508.1 hypothetical protein [Fusibacter tunisiensis]